MGFLTLRAYHDGDTTCTLEGSLADKDIADTLDRYEVPFFGPLASSFVDEE